jgi:hypothetical protein
VSFNGASNKLQVGVTKTTVHNGVTWPTIGASIGLYESDAPNISDNGGPFDDVGGGASLPSPGFGAARDFFWGQSPDGLIIGQQQSLTVGASLDDVDGHVMRTYTTPRTLWTWHL